MTDQPNWDYVDNLGDVDPLEHDGYFLYRDTTGVYGYEAERLAQQCDGTYLIHRVCLDRCKIVTVTDEENGSRRDYLVPFSYQETWPHPVHAYQEWYADSLREIANYIGVTRGVLVGWLCSESGTDRAMAYQAIGDYHGWDNLDSLPRLLTRDQVKARYTSGELE